MVDSAITASQNIVCFYKLSLHTETNIIQKLTKKLNFLLLLWWTEPANCLVENTPSEPSCQISYAAEAEATGLQHLQQGRICVHQELG
jgi:hypothetical protein